MINKEGIVISVKEIASHMAYYANQVKECAERLEETDDLMYAAEALGHVRACYGNLLLDRVAMRIVREYEQK